MSAVLVTGGTGFIGLHLVEALVGQGTRVHCLVRPTSQVAPLQALGVELVTVSSEDPGAWQPAMAGVDTVYHVAGVIRAFRRADFFRANEQVTERVAAACAAQANPPTLVLVSSLAAAGPCPRGHIRTERDPPQPRSDYGRSKLAAEQAATRFAGQVPLTIVRPGIVFGPRDTGFSQVLRAIRRGYCHLSPGFSPPPLSYLHIADLVSLMLAAAQRGRRVPPAATGEIGQGCYFAAAPEHPTYAEFGRLVRPLLGRPHAPIVPIPGPLAYGLGTINEGIGWLRGRAEELCRDKIRDALAPSWACSGAQAQAELGAMPARPLIARLEETVAWCLKNNWL